MFISQNVKISDYEIIKRQTDKKNKSDIIYLTVRTADTNLTCELSYMMQYTLYNDGWVLESVERYADGPWSIEGLSEEQLLEDIQLNDPFFLEYDNLIITDYEVCDEGYDYIDGTYKKWMTVSVCASTSLFNYTSYNMIDYFITEDGWDICSVWVDSSHYTPTFVPDVSSTDKIMDTLEYDAYEYLDVEENFENCEATVLYTAKSEYKFGTEVYTVSIPIKFSLDGGRDSVWWSYSSKKIEAQLETVNWNVEGVWIGQQEGSTDRKDWNAHLEIKDIAAADEPGTFSAKVSSNSIYSQFAFIETTRLYCVTDGFVDTVITQTAPGHYKMEVTGTKEGFGGWNNISTKDGVFFINLVSDFDEWSGIFWSQAGVKLYRQQ